MSDTLPAPVPMQASPLATMPIELLDMICGELPNESIKNLRFVTRELAVVGLRRITPETIRVLFDQDHTVGSCLERLQGITNNQIMGQNVKAIVISLDHGAEIGNRHRYNLRSQSGSEIQSARLLGGEQMVPMFLQAIRNVPRLQRIDFDDRCFIVEFESERRTTPADKLLYALCNANSTSIKQLRVLQLGSAGLNFLFDPVYAGIQNTNLETISLSLAYVRTKNQVVLGPKTTTPGVQHPRTFTPNLRELTIYMSGDVTWELWSVIFMRRKLRFGPLKWSKLRSLTLTCCCVEYDDFLQFLLNHRDCLRELNLSCIGVARLEDAKNERAFLGQIKKNLKLESFEHDGMAFGKDTAYGVTP